MRTTIVFDMDGTIADLYNQKDWLEKVRMEDPSPYLDAKPLCNMQKVIPLLHELKKLGFGIVITSWGSLTSSEKFLVETQKAKKDWLDKIGFPYDELNVVHYGTPKEEVTKHLGGIQILVDDDSKVRKSWNLGRTVDPTKINIEFYLMGLLGMF